MVYGHTHAAEIVPLDASHAEGYVLDQVYFNAGSWRRTFRPAAFAPSGQEFVAADTFGYLAFFQGDERKGRSYEAWNGTLGHAPGADRPPHRRRPDVAGRPVGHAAAALQVVSFQRGHAGCSTDIVTATVNG